MSIICNTFFSTPVISGMGKDIIVIKEESKKYNEVLVRVLIMLMS